MKILALMLIFNSLWVFPANKSYTITSWGQVVEVSDPKQQIGKFKYFFILKKEGEQFAYPLKFKKKLSDKELEKFKNSFVQVVGKITEIDAPQVEKVKKIIVLQVEDIRILEASKLGLMNAREPLQQSPFKPVIEERGVRVSDKIANTIIFTSGALILGGLIQGQILEN